MSLPSVDSPRGLPAELREKYADTPWSEIAGARDVMVHEYFRVDLELAWEMVQEDIGPLAVTVRRILKEQFSDDEGAV